MRLRPALLAILFVACLASNTWAVEKASEQVSPFFGSFGHGIPIEVPPFRGLEPHLSLGYSSEGRNGFVGVGWSLGGFSTIERTNAGGGTPRWDGTDVYRLDGAKMLACQAGMASPGCAAGGTHATENENFKRIKRDAASNSWTVWEKSGVRSVYTALMNAAQGTYRWGLSQVIDTKGNTVNYAWQCDTDCYPSAVTYGPYAVWMARETRPDVLTYARGADLGRTTQRLLSVIVWMPGVGHIRGYKLTYGSSPQTNRSLLASVQQFGKDLAHTDGLITGGTSLPPHNFTYTTDPQGRTFVSQGDQPTSPPGTTEPVEWSELVNTEPINPTNSLEKIDGVNGEWDARGTSTRALASGNGYLEAVAAGGYVKRWGLSRKIKDFQPAEIDYAFEMLGGVPGPVVVKAYEKGTVYGPWNANVGDMLRIEINNGAVQWKLNGNLLRERPAGMKVGYPLAGVATITRKQEAVGPAVLSGSLRDVAGWCWGEQLLTGDFNGDGRTDQACYTSLTQAMRVRLSTGTGFADPAVWRAGYDYSKSVTGDFDNDGKTDVAAFNQYGSEFYVTLSTGTGPRRRGELGPRGRDGPRYRLPLQLRDALRGPRGRGLRRRRASRRLLSPGRLGQPHRSHRHHHRPLDRHVVPVRVLGQPRLRRAGLPVDRRHRLRRRRQGRLVLHRRGRQPAGVRLDREPVHLPGLREPGTQLLQRALRAGRLQRRRSDGRALRRQRQDCALDRPQLRRAGRVRLVVSLPAGRGGSDHPGLRG